MIFIDREAREIMHLVASVRPYVLSVTLNKKLVEVSHMGIKGGSSLVNRFVD